jgi:hypothetical protein
MRHVVRCLCLLFCFLFPVALYAGQIYGFIVKEDGTPLKNAEININCGGAPISGTTASDGTYRIPVPQTGNCKLTLPNIPGAWADVVSYPNPSQYNFQLVGDKLRRR